MTTEIEHNEVVTDRLGQNINVGDVIAYGHALGRCAGLQLGKVLSVKVKVIPPEFKTWDWTRPENNCPQCGHSVERHRFRERCAHQEDCSGRECGCVFQTPEYLIKRPERYELETPIQIRPERRKYRITVWGVNEDWGGKYKPFLTSRKGILQFPDRMIVIPPDKIPADVAELLKDVTIYSTPKSLDIAGQSYFERRVPREKEA